MGKKVSEIRIGDIVRFKDEQEAMDPILSKFYKANKEKKFKVASIYRSSLRLEGDYQGCIGSRRFVKLDLGVEKQDDLKEELKSNNLIMESQEKEIERLNQIIRTKDGEIKRLNQIIISQDEEKERIAKRETTTFENYSDSLQQLNKEIGIQREEIEKLDNQLRNHRLTLQFALNL